MKKIIFAIIAAVSLLSSVQLFAQTLPRRGSFGVGVKPLDEATAAANRLKTGDGLLVTLVTPDSTVAALGLKAGDIIVSVDGRGFSSVQDFVAFARTKNEGDSAEFVFLSNGEKFVKKGSVKGRPRENSDNAEVRYDAVEMALGTLRTITYVPKGKTGRLPAVFYIQGLPCQSQEMGPNSKDPRKMAFEDWVRGGFVVFRVERPNLGDSRTTKDCRDIDFDEEVAVNVAGYKKLLGYDFVDPDNVFFFGHSMGSWTAPFIARTRQPRGIITYGSGVRSWFEYFIDAARIQAVYAGATHVEAEKEARRMIPFYYEWLEAGKSPDEMRKNPALREIVDEAGNFDGDYFQGREAGRSAHYFYTMSKQMTAEAWSRISCKVLSAYGEFDVQALNSRDAETIAAIVNEAHPGSAEYLLIPKTEHIFAKATSYKQVMELYKTGKYWPYAAENYNPEFGRITVEWMKKTMK
ncbi:MAG: alpha/beta fold hydrolase [Acidobacteria bacterium]|nr:alpha/beta fold hydrolase [Acidobacteriota bacterium]